MKLEKCKNFLLLFWGLLLISIPKFVLAACDPGQYETQFGGCINQPLNENALPDYIQTFWTKILPIAVGLTVLVIMYGGYRYITSAGNPEALTAAKDIIISAVVGLILLLLAWVIWEQIRYPVSSYELPSSAVLVAFQKIVK